MRKHCSLLLLIIGISSTVYSQDVIIDTEMSNLVIQNYITRSASESFLKNQASNAKKNLDKMNEAYLQVVFVHDQIVNSLENVNSSFKQIHKIKNMSVYVSEIMSNSAAVVNLCANHPQYSTLGYKHAQNALQHVIALQSEVTNFALKGTNNLLMNYRERDEIVRDISTRLVLINANLVLIRKAIERAIRVGFFRSVVPFGDWLNTDVRMVENIIRRSKFL